MIEAIKNFSRQFEYEPKVENEDGLGKFNRFVVVGMGGSNHPTGLLKIWKPELDITIHRNYGLPSIPEEGLKNSLIILSSYSGNTEEVTDAFHAAGERKLARAVISTGGKLLDLAKKEKVPFVEIPDTNIQQRLALGLIFKALLKVMGQEEALGEVRQLAGSLDVTRYESTGRGLAEKLKGFVPIVYSSARNGPLAYVWKIVLNETAKIPVFYNVLPELNHNEMTGFSAGGGSAFGGKNISKKNFSIEKDIFPKLARSGKLGFYAHRGFWTDAGTEERLREAQKHFS